MVRGIDRAYTDPLDRNREHEDTSDAAGRLRFGQDRACHGGRGEGRNQIRYL